MKRLRLHLGLWETFDTVFIHFKDWAWNQLIKKIINSKNNWLVAALLSFKSPSWSIFMNICLVSLSPASRHATNVSTKVRIEYQNEKLCSYLNWLHYVKKSCWSLFVADFGSRCSNEENPAAMIFCFMWLNPEHPQRSTTWLSE